VRDEVEVLALRAAGDGERAEGGPGLVVGAVAPRPQTRVVAPGVTILLPIVLVEGTVNIEERLKRYRAIEDYRKRPLIVFATSTRQGVRAQMGGDAVREFIDQVNAISDGSQVDVLLHSYGGDALAAWKIMSVLRERFKHVGVLVPSAAFSAATVFALGADEIVMHPHASLGPIDPQITVRLPDGSGRQFAYEDLGAFLRFLEHEVGLTEQPHLAAVIDRLFGIVDPLIVGGAKRASDLSAAVGERLLALHMSDDRKAKQIAVNLNKSFFAHGDAVSRTRARRLELKIKKDDKTLEQLLWEAFLGIEGHMELREPFQPLALYLADPAGAESLEPAGPLKLPANMPPQIAGKVWEAAANQAIGNQGKAPQVPYSYVTALIEGTRLASEFRSVGTISAARQPSGEVRISQTDVGKWTRVTVGSPAPGPVAAAPTA
jgi:hypothetical protein